MQKPQGYDGAEAKQAGSFDKLEAGAHVCKILQATDGKSEAGRPMLILGLDVAEGKHANHFKKLFDFLRSKNNQMKWPCVYRQCTDGEQVPYFKGVIKAIEESNPGFTFNFDEKSLAGKLVGCIFGEKEIDANGKTILEPRFICSAGKARTGEIKPPAVKKFAGYRGQTEDAQEEKLPF